jgi:CheY-like chemotaxis protein
MARVLVVDDETDVRQTIKTILERRGHKVVLAACGNRALAITEVFAFDAIIVDIFMPGMDGFETIKVLRRCVPKVKVIAISGYVFRGGATPTPDFLRMAADLGATCCLHKPFRASELVAAIDTHCGSSQSARRSA